MLVSLMELVRLNISGIDDHLSAIKMLACFSTENFKNVKLGAGGVAQWLRGMVALVENLIG